MKNYPVFIFLLFNLVGSTAQTSYEFDYAMECEKTSDNLKSKFFIFTNSKDNSYQLVVTDLDKDNYNVHFSHSNGITATRTSPKSKFFKAETVHLECSQGKYNISFRSQLDKDVEYRNLKDTIIDNKRFAHYSLIFPDKKAKKRKGETHYVIYPDTGFHSPILNPQSGEYDEWKKEGGIPNGIVKERYTMFPDGKKVEILSVVQYVQHSKNIIVSACQSK